jgi:ChrR-like protein with cupin domain
MRITREIAIIAFVLVATFAQRLFAQNQASMTDAHHVMLTPSEMKWAPFPALGLGIQIAVLTGDPFKSGSPFVSRLKLPNSTKVPPHWHPVDEHITVISGIFLLGAGDKFDTNATRELPAGSYAFMPRRAHHFAFVNGDTVIQLNGVGPFNVIYVNPADDPSRKAALPSRQSTYLTDFEQRPQKMRG